MDIIRHLYYIYTYNTSMTLPYTSWRTCTSVLSSYACARIAFTFKINMANVSAR